MKNFKHKAYSSNVTIEWYIIRYDRKKSDGYWERNLTETITLKIGADQPIKVNHELAKKVFLTNHQHETVEVTVVTYV